MNNTKDDKTHFLGISSKIDRGRHLVTLDAEALLLQTSLFSLLLELVKWRAKAENGLANFPDHSEASLHTTICRLRKSIGRDLIINAWRGCYFLTPGLNINVSRSLLELAPRFVEEPLLKELLRLYPVNEKSMSSSTERW